MANMMTMRRFGWLTGVLLVGILVGALSGVASAQGVPPEPAGADGDEDEIVTLTGVFVEHIGDNDYLFEHAGTQIVASGGPPWHHTLDLPLAVEVTVTGEIGDGPPWLDVPKEPELDLFSVTLEDGTVIEIRSGDGPPPWAGGPNGNADDDDEGPPSWLDELFSDLGLD